MSYTAQYIIVGIVFAGAIALTVRSVYRALTHKKSALVACDGCKLKDSCLKMREEKTECPHDGQSAEE